MCQNKNSCLNASSRCVVDSQCANYSSPEGCKLIMCFGTPICLQSKKQESLKFRFKIDHRERKIIQATWVNKRPDLNKIQEGGLVYHGPITNV